MKKAISLLRIASLIFMGCIATMLLFGEEQDEEFLPFILHFVFDKAIALAMIAGIVTFAARWSKKDHLFKAIGKLCEED